jgi:predicted secreted protein
MRRLPAFDSFLRVHQFGKSLLLGFVLIATTACQSTPGGIPANAVVVTAAQNGGAVSVKPGQMLVIELSGNPETGYVWQLVQTPSAQYLLPDGTKQFQSDSARASASQIETQYIRFVAQEAGELTLELNYVIPSVGPQAETRRFSVDVVIE